MKADDFRKLSDDELAQREQDLSEEYFNLRFQFFTGQLENTARMRGVRKDIARAKTIRRERGNEPASAGSEG
ncbi:MAG: 50S ribosomal protein L29 [Deltaproteobacteria bacterium]|nr:50S ribosomal protein L29 [Deltaproteobacteria bacterium]MCB9479016.1 50S ribosomal protein L29 [Deltaproteobacteria bacterium]MCB9487776.1 50S ribosomal protein L29 [Deltaproteobacteria bacterium]